MKVDSDQGFVRILRAKMTKFEWEPIVPLTVREQNFITSSPREVYLERHNR